MDKNAPLSSIQRVSIVLLPTIMRHDYGSLQVFIVERQRMCMEESHFVVHLNSPIVLNVDGLLFLFRTFNNRRDNRIPRVQSHANEILLWLFFIMTTIFSELFVSLKKYIYILHK